MSLQTGLSTRRKFLERSALGASSLLFAPLLLESCTDHIINPPDNPINPPLLGDTGFAWNDDARTLISSAIEMIPVAGDLLGGLVDILWPSTTEDVWGQIKGQVEALIQQDIANNVYQQVTEDLQGLKNSLILYLNEVKNYNQALLTNPKADPSDLRDQWISTRNLFVYNLPHFQSAGNELPLLPLFAQFANLYLSLLRDGVKFGQSWGRSDNDHLTDISDLKNNINGFWQYTSDTYIAGLANVEKNTKPVPDQCEPFKTVNTYVRQMTLTVLVFRDSWYYYDVTVYPNGVTFESTLEIYSDPYGSCIYSGNIVISQPPPTQLPTQVSVWGYGRIEAVQVTYPAGSGPNGITQTARMGDQPDGQNGGQNFAPYGGVFNLSPDNPIIAGRVLFDGWQDLGGQFHNLVTGLQFLYADRSQSNMCGAKTRGYYQLDTGWIGYTDMALSSIHINGADKIFITADSIVLGFQYWKSPSVTLRAIRTIYVKSPKERSAADLTKDFPKVAIPADLITEALKVERAVYWAYIEAYAKAHK